jgi:hypothetical protein
VGEVGVQAQGDLLAGEVLGDGVRLEVAYVLQPMRWSTRILASNQSGSGIG